MNESTFDILRDKENYFMYDLKYYFVCFICRAFAAIGI